MSKIKISNDINISIPKQNTVVMSGIVSEPDEAIKTIHQRSLESLPPEILFNILSYLDEPDLFILQKISITFNNLINDEELWKNLFISRYNTINFPSYSKSIDYHTEYIQRRDSLNFWKHNRIIKTKYIISPLRTNQFQQNENFIENLVFDYPRCACYNDGTITLVHLQNKRSKQRLTYIPCTTPQGCSTMDFNINAAVFGRFDGRVFGKLLSNKSYLTPVTEFNAAHSSCVTAITSSSNDSIKEYQCVSGSENGEIIWWQETKKITQLKISNSVIWKLYYWKNWTIAIDHQRIYIIKDMTVVNSIPLPLECIRSNNNNTQQNNESNILQFINVDFGSTTLIMASISTLYTISFNLDKDFGSIKSLDIKNYFPNINTTISNLYIDETTALKEQDSSLAGNDGCFIALLTSNNDIVVINIRNSGSTIKIQNTLSFDEKIYTLRITNLLLLVAISNQIHIVDSSNGTPIKIFQKTDKYPQFLKLSQNKLITGSGNTLHFLEFISNKNSNSDVVGSNKSYSSSKNRSNKWNETMNSQLETFEEEQTYLQEQQLENDRLLRTYGGDISALDQSNEHLIMSTTEDEDIHLRIALLESQTSASTQNNEMEVSRDEEEQLRRAIEESQLLHNQSENYTSENENTVLETEDDDEEFRRIVELSRLDHEQNDRINNPRRILPLSDDTIPIMNTQSTPTSNSGGANSTSMETSHNGQLTEDEELQLALALSLSEMN